MMYTVPSALLPFVLKCSFTHFFQCFKFIPKLQQYCTLSNPLWAACWHLGNTVYYYDNCNLLSPLLCLQQISVCNKSQNTSRRKTPSYLCTNPKLDGLQQILNNKGAGDEDVEKPVQFWTISFALFLYFIDNKSSTWALYHANYIANLKLTFSSFRH